MFVERGSMRLRPVLTIATLVSMCSYGCGAANQVPANPVGPAVCAPTGRYVAVGGTAGFDALADPRFTPRLRATGRVRLYEHATAVADAISESPRSNPYAILHAIERVFTGSGPGEAELGLLGADYFTLPPSQYRGYYQYQYVKSGLLPDEASVDVPYGTASSWRFTKANVQAWTSWVVAGRSVGVQTLGPEIAPNGAWKPGPAYPPAEAEYYDINSAYYKLARFEALYGGALALDTPSDFFLSGGSGRGYQQFVEDAIRWGNVHGLRTTVLISPLSRRTFSDDTQKYVAILTAHDAVPAEWAVDDYEDTNPHDAAAMGPETVANTTTQVALWLATHAPAFIGGRICSRRRGRI